MKQLNDALKQLKSPTETCKVCFKDLSPYSFRTFIKNVDECNKCFASKVPKFIKFTSNGVKCLSIYEYDDALKSRIFQLKACFDIELANSFLSTYALELRLMYFNRYIVFVPSYFKDDEARGFNHVEEIFKVLKLKQLNLLEKVEHHKQSDQKFINRSEIKKYIKLVNNQDLHGKHILLVDDIYTTGNTMNTCIDLIKSLHPKSIKVLVLCKVMNHEKE